jgi:hypothetical protein
MEQKRGVHHLFAILVAARFREADFSGSGLTVLTAKDREL